MNSQCWLFITFFMSFFFFINLLLKLWVAGYVFCKLTINFVSIILFLQKNSQHTCFIFLFVINTSMNTYNINSPDIFIPKRATFFLFILLIKVSWINIFLLFKKLIYLVCTSTMLAAFNSWSTLKSVYNTAYKTLISRKVCWQITFNAKVMLNRQGHPSKLSSPSTVSNPSFDSQNRFV